MCNKINFKATWQFVQCLVFVLINSLPTLLNAQFEVGVWAGSNNYQGDLADATVELRESQLAYGGLMRYNINRHFTVRAHYLKGKMTGRDLNSSDVAVRQRSYSLQSNLNELGFIGEWNILGNSNERNYFDFKLLFNPYIFTGIAITGTSGTPVAPSDAVPYPFPEQGSRNVFVGVPLGLGVKLQPLEFLSIGIEWGGRTVFSDYLDGVSKNGNPKRKDWYMFGGLTLTYCFGYDSY